MEEYRVDMTTAQEINWCCQRIIELYPALEKEHIEAKKALALAKKTCFSRAKEKPSECLYCGEPNVYAKGLCHSCYARYRQNGSPEYRTPFLESEEEPEEDIIWYEKLRYDVLGDEAKPIQDPESAVLFVLDKLDEREKGIILLRYKDGKSYFKIANEYGISRERVRQIILKSIRVMQMKNCIIFLELGVEKAKEVLAENIRVQKEAEKNMLEQASKKYALSYDEAKLECCNLTIDSLEIDIRAYNCLMRAGIETVKELVEYLGSPMDYDKLLKIRNLGKLSAKSIENALKKFLSGYEKFNQSDK